MRPFPTQSQKQMSPKLGKGMLVQIKETFRIPKIGMSLSHYIIIIRPLNIQNKENILNMARYKTNPSIKAVPVAKQNSQ